VIRLLRKQLRSCRAGIIAGLFAFAIGQTISLAHAADASLHANGEPCQICLAIGHAAAPPAPASAPGPAIEFRVVSACADVVAAVLRPTFSAHSARAPPTFL